MEYEIHCNGKLIARFAHERDRDTCLDSLKEEYSDSLFETE